jgi:hypothetical protein
MQRQVRAEPEISVGSIVNLIEAGVPSFLLCSGFHLELESRWKFECVYIQRQPRRSVLLVAASGRSKAKTISPTARQNRKSPDPAYSLKYQGMNPPNQTMALHLLSQLDLFINSGHLSTQFSEACVKEPLDFITEHRSVESNGQK